MKTAGCILAEEFAYKQEETRCAAAIDRAIDQALAAAESRLVAAMALKGGRSQEAKELRSGIERLMAIAGHGVEGNDSGVVSVGDLMRLLDRVNAEVGK